MPISNVTPLICNTNEALIILREAKYGEHILVIYDDLATLQELYGTVALGRLPANKEAMLLLTYLETPEKIRRILENKGLRVSEYQKDGSLAIIDAFPWFFGNEILSQEHIAKIANNVKKDGKDGLVIFQDIGVFFLTNEIDRLIGSELRHRTEETEGRKTICCINRGDYERLPAAYREVLIFNHDKSLVAINSTKIIFEEALAQSINEAMAVYGKQISQIVSNYLENKHSIPPRSLGDNPRALVEALHNALDSGS